MTPDERILIAHESALPSDIEPLRHALATGLDLLELGNRQVSILLCDDDGLTEIAYDDVPAVRDLRRFLDDPRRQVALLLGER